MAKTEPRGGQIKDDTLTAADMAAANKDGVAGTASLRTLGTGAQQAAPGNLKLDDLQVPDDNADLNASITKHGLLKKLPNDAAKRLDGVGNWITPAAAGGLTAIHLGDGSDGAVTISADTTLTRPMNYSSLTIDTTKTLFNDGYSIRVTGAVDNNGTLANDGNVGGNGSGGSGGNPGIATGNGNNIDFASGSVGSGGGIASSTFCTGGLNLKQRGYLGGGIGAGGVGGDGTTDVGCPGGIITINDGRHFGIPNLATYAVASGVTGGVRVAGVGGAGGGAGGNDNINSGGGGGAGGAGGGGTYLACGSYDGTGGVITADGGAGGTGAAAAGGDSGGGGGGSGGGGGAIYLIYKTLTALGTVTRTGGAGGAGGAGTGSGTNGAAGAAGTAGWLIQIDLTADSVTVT